MGVGQHQWVAPCRSLEHQQSGARAVRIWKAAGLATAPNHLEKLSWALKLVSKAEADAVWP
jgi:hypothetical protein